MEEMKISKLIHFTDMMEEVIEEFENLRDLGVHMNNHANVAKKSRQKMGYLMRSFHCRNIMFMKQMFKTLVTPHIDYNSQLYMPIECSEIQIIEKVQRDFFRKIPALCGLSY